MNERRFDGKWSSMAGRLLGGLAVTGLFVSGVVWFADPSELFETWSEARPGWLAAALLLYGGVLCGRWVRLMGLTDTSALSNHRLELLWASAGHSFATQLLPARSGEFAFPVLWRRATGESYAEGVVLLTAVRLVELGVLAPLFALGMVGWLAGVGAGGTGAWLALVVGGAGLAIVLSLPYLLAAGVEVADWLFNRTLVARFDRLEPLREAVPRARNAVEGLGRGEWIWLVGSSLAVWLLLFGVYGSALAACGLDLGAAQTVVGASGGILGNLIPVGAIGSIGTMEAGWTAAFRATGAPVAAVAAAGFLVHGIVIVGTGAGAALAWLGARLFDAKSKIAPMASSAVFACMFVAAAPALAQEEQEEPASEEGAEEDEPVRLTPPDEQADGTEEPDSEDEEESETEDEAASSAETGSEGDEESEGADEDDALEVPEVEVVGRSKKEVESVPGSADVVDEQELEDQNALNANEAMRSVPGVHVQPEEGMGLRQNIGIRGLNPTRSRKVHVMEDGVPIALGPYGEPEMYYSPPVERMSRIEIVKGSGSILYGPQTIGGVVNYITPQPPEDFTVTTEARGGTFGYGQGQLTVGDTTDDGVGYWLNGLHQRFRGHRDIQARVTDATSKFTFDLDDQQTLSLKFNVYDEWSRSTYLGLTTPQYEADPSANYAENDRFAIRRYGAQATHVWVPGAEFVLETRLYGHNIQRNWMRQDFDRTPSCEREDCYQRVIDGDGSDVVDDPSLWDTDRSQIFFRNSTGNRNREFTVGGVEPRGTIFWSAGPVDNELQTGFRFHVEHTHERRVDGDRPVALSGTIRDEDERLGRALAVYGLNRIKLLEDRLEISPGLRLESLWTSRTIHRTRVEGEPRDLYPPRQNDKQTTALLPGLGTSYRLVEPLTLFGGVHRGFAPPRTKDAITKDGQSLALEAEYSWNWELGARVQRADWLQAELTGFILDFQNQIIAPAESGGAVSVDPESGGVGALAAVQGGETIHRGVEFGGTFDVASYLGAGFDTPVSTSYTFVNARFQDGWKQSIRGNRLPYSPEHRVAGRVGFRHPSGLKLQVDGDWLSGQFTDKIETVRPNRAGLIGRIDSRFVLDANVSYTWKPWGLTAFVSGKNLLNEQYIASRAPRGIKPGLFRHVYGGIRLEI